MMSGNAAQPDPTEAYKERIVAAVRDNISSTRHLFCGTIPDDEGYCKPEAEEGLHDTQAAILTATADYLDALVGGQEEIPIGEFKNGELRVGSELHKTAAQKVMNRNDLKAELRQTIDQLRKP